MITNGRGDVVELLDANGNAFAAYHYDAWGLPQGSGNGITTTSTNLITSTLASQIASRQVLRYADYVYDSESALYYCSARYYDPATRQWTTADSAKADGEESAYQYCGGDPVDHTDPTGEGWHYRPIRVSGWGGWFTVYVNWWYDTYWGVTDVSMWATSLKTYGFDEATRRYDWSYWYYDAWQYKWWRPSWENRFVANGAFGSFGRTWITKARYIPALGMDAGTTWLDVYIWHSGLSCYPHDTWGHCSYSFAENAWLWAAGQ